jgi:hypothetical protein
MADQPQSRWTFLTNHTHVLVCIARDPDVRLRDVAQLVGITERAAQGIVGDLVDAGYISRTRVGRRNRYSINDAVPLRHALEQDQLVGKLLHVVTPLDRGDARNSAASGGPW